MHRLPRLALLATVPLALALLAGTAFASLAKLDARARTALGSLRLGAPVEQLKADGAALNDAGELDVFITGSVSRAALEAAGARVRTEVPGAGIFTAYVPVGAVEAVAALADVSAIRGAAPCEPELDLSVPTTGAHALRGAGPAFAGLNGAGVVLGDVDSGIDFDHPDFENVAGNTRLLGLWDQTEAVAVGPPSGYLIGREWTPAEIDGGLCIQTDVSGHGTHVMGILGGDGSGTGGAVPAHTYTGMAPMADLMMVKTTFQTTDILDGVAYILGKAQAVGKPCVVNLSLGSHYGPHDGTSPFEAGLSALSGPGRVIVKSAGNERSATNIRHAEVFASGAGTSATFSVSGSANGRILAIAGYYEASENISVRITTPGGTTIGPIALGGINAAYPGTLTPNGYVYLENGAALTATGDREIYVELRATGSSSNGTWTFTFIPVALGAAAGEVDLWRFFNSSGISGNWVVGADNGTELVSEPGNAVEVVTTAAWTSKQNWLACSGILSTFTGTPAPGNLAPFSSPGPTRDGRMKPDIAAPGLAIGSTRSFDISATCPAGSPSTYLNDGMNHVINSGTSMAAPHVTGAIGLLMQKYGFTVTPAFAKSFLSGRAIVDGFTGAVPNTDWGAGKLHLGDLLDPAVAVTAPNGGESAIIGAITTLTWNASDNVGVTAVDLHVSRGGPAGPWELVVAGHPNTGAFAWMTTGPATTDAWLRVVAHDAAGNTAEDLSDAAWSIVDFATPALLSTFTADAVDGGIELRWAFGDGAGVRDVSVERAPASDGPWVRIDVEVRTDGVFQVALDRGAPAGRTSWYRLVGVRDGRAVTFGPLAGVAGRAITEFALTLIAPNPAAGAARVEFTVPRLADVRVSILDVQGRELEVLADGPHAPGRHQLAWAGTLGGRRAPAGLYFVRVQAEGRSLVRRLAVQR
uniref:Peptidase S8/S53 domain-containing protein n=1 Tax=Eiseniibacteriota bacterium TaxID=2212470 RepID=A0A832HZ99_UNCEI